MKIEEMSRTIEKAFRKTRTRIPSAHSDRGQEQISGLEHAFRNFLIGLAIDSFVDSGFSNPIKAGTVLTFSDIRRVIARWHGDENYLSRIVAAYVHAGILVKDGPRTQRYIVNAWYADVQTVAAQQPITRLVHFVVPVVYTPPVSDVSDRSRQAVEQISRLTASFIKYADVKIIGYANDDGTMTPYAG